MLNAFRLIHGRLFCCLPALLCFCLGQQRSARADEFRGLWVDTFHAALRDADEVSQLVAHARGGNFNALVVEVRKRGDAYYDSRFEPKASDVALGFDPLDELLRQAHSTTAGPRLEVHAWIVTYNIWNQETALPPQADHPYRLHPDWLTRSDAGAAWDGSNYALDPGHPGVQEHTYQVAMDLISRYDVDGLHWDYVRYAGPNWGYNDVAVARFNQQTGSAGTPVSDDSAWLQWRRDQVTSLVRRVYLSAIALKPALKMSAATITWTPSPTSYSQWLTSAAYSKVLQDWRGWMEEGLLDLNIPMAYFRQEQNAADWANWSRFAKENRYGRHLALGVGAYFNTVSNTLVQMSSTRQAAGAAGPAEGVVCYSYAVLAKGGVPRSEFLEALTGPSVHHPNADALFPAPAIPQGMPWKAGIGPAGIMGYVRDARTGHPIEGVTIEVCDSTTPFLKTDGHGFYGMTKSPNTTPSLVTSAAPYATEVRWVTVRPGEITRADFDLWPPDAATAPQNIRLSAGARSALVSWSTRTPTSGHVLYGLGGPCDAGGATASDSSLGTNHTVFLSSLEREDTNDFRPFRLRVVAWNDRSTNLSELREFSPAWPQISDDTQARWTGAWTFVTNSATSVRQAYRRAPGVSGSPTAALTWRTQIPTPGYYDLSILYPTNASGSSSVPCDIETAADRKTVVVNQSVGGGVYRTIAINLYCAAGETTNVRLRNNAGAGSSVLADAVRWTLRPGQDPPPGGKLPEWWSHHFFGEMVGGTPDADEDGYSNGAEFVLGTDPTNPASALQIRSVSLDESGWRIRFYPRHEGRTYRLLRASDLEAPVWQAIPATHLVAAPRDEGVITDPHPDGTQTFYRLEVDL